MGRLQTRRQRGDDGTTLAELNVTMMVFSLVLVLVATLFIGSLRSTAQTRARVDETVDARIGIAAMSRALRTAVMPSQLSDAGSTGVSAVTSATTRSITFHANLDRVGRCTGGTPPTPQSGLTAPQRITYAVTPGGDLVETKQAPQAWTCGTPSYTYCTPAPGCAVSTTVLARQVQGGSIFSYYDQLGVPVPVPAAGALTTAQLTSVGAVDLTLSVRAPQSSADGSTYALRVSLPNHDAAVRTAPNGS